MLIIGQGLAGSLLGWACERAGVSFRIIDAGHEQAASSVGAGLITPLTGRRLAPTWRIAEWREEALATYREIETLLQRPLVTEIRIRRFYRDPTERSRLEARLAEPAVARWIDGRDAEGLWLAGGAQIETAALIAGLRERWRARGWLREELGHEALSGRAPLSSPSDRLLTEPLAARQRPEVRQSSAAFDPAGSARVIWCTGAARVETFDFVPWERAKGEVISGELPGLEPRVLLNDGHWVLPGPDSLARVGATYDRDALDAAPTPEARATLEAAACRLSGRAIRVTTQRAALRVTTPDRRPVIGWHPADPRCGIFSGLGSKGALWAPALARQWLALLRDGHRVERDVDVARFERSPRDREQD